MGILDDFMHILIDITRNYEVDFGSHLMKFTHCQFVSREETAHGPR